MSTGEVFNFLQNASATSSFFKSLFDQLDNKGYLSNRQMDCVRRAMEKAAAPKIEAKEVDLSAIHQMFNTARANGLKKLAYRANGLVIKPAKETGRNPGALYVMDANTDQYLGKVVETKFFATREAPATVTEAVETIAKDPLEAARLWGKQTGSCSCCGRELTDPVSIERSIGPICEAKWFGGRR